MLGPWKEPGKGKRAMRVRVYATVLVFLLTAAAVVRGEPLPGQIVVDPEDPRWLVRYDPGGKHKPFFMCGPGDPEDFLYRGKRRPDGTRDGDQADIIRCIKGTGANCIYLMAVRSHGGDGDADHNPFISGDPAKGLNQKVLEQWETWFAEMDAAGTVIYFFIYDDSARIWKGDAVSDAERTFLEGLVRRFKHHKHLIWCVAEEYGEKLSRKRAGAIAAAVRAADNHQHVIAVHQNNGLAFHFADDPNIDQFAVQWNNSEGGTLHRDMVKAFKAAGGKFHLNLSENARHRDQIKRGDRAALRQDNWACAMAGAHVMWLGAWAPNGKGAPPTDEMLRDAGRLVRFFEAADLTGMQPHDELAHAATRYVLARPGRRYIAYSHEGNGGEKMGMREMAAGRYRFNWLDTVTGKTATEIRNVAAGDAAWPVPAGFGQEVAVHVVIQSDKRE